VFSYGQWRKADQQKHLALEAVNHLTYDIPRRLIDLPGSRPALRTIFEENLHLLARIADARAEEEERTNFRYMGDIWLLLGDTEQANGAYRKSLAIAVRLAKRRSGMADRWELAVSSAMFAWKGAMPGARLHSTSRVSISCGIWQRGTRTSGSGATYLRATRR
jgi:hypothetical protein